MRLFIVHYEGQHTSSATIVCCDFDLFAIARTNGGLERVAEALNMTGFCPNDDSLTVYPVGLADMRILPPFPKKDKRKN